MALTPMISRWHAICSDGSLDTTFSGNGKVFTDFGGSDGAYAVAIQSNGKIVAGGSNRTGTVDDFALARFTSNGSLDTTFSGDGKVTTDFSGSYDEAYALAIQGNGKIVAAGSSPATTLPWPVMTVTRPQPLRHALPPTQTPGGPRYPNPHHLPYPVH